jgi:7-keto-8-aminopelargonate synthetase-like enzyme
LDGRRETPDIHRLLGGNTEAGFKSNAAIETTSPTNERDAHQPVIVGEARQAHELSRPLFEEGVLATGIGFPTVPKGKARVRTIMTATHTREELDRALEAFRRVGKRMGLV